MKKMLAVIITLLLAAMPILAQDEAPVLELPILASGTTTEGVLLAETQAQLYAFNGTEGDTVTLSMTQTVDELDPFLVLLGPAGQVVASDDDSGTTETFSALIDAVSLPVTGTYFVVATSYEYIDNFFEFDASVQLTYELTVEGFVDSAQVEGTLDYAAGQLISDSAITGQSTPEEPVYFYTFMGNAQDVIGLTLEAAEFDTVLHLFAPGGQRIAINDDIDTAASNFNSAIAGLELPLDGQYFVFATDVFFYDAVPTASNDTLIFSGGEFTITLTGATGEPLADRTSTK